MKKRKLMDMSVSVKFPVMLYGLGVLIGGTGFGLILPSLFNFDNPFFNKFSVIGFIMIFIGAIWNYLIFMKYQKELGSKNHMSPTYWKWLIGITILIILACLIISLWLIFM